VLVGRELYKLQNASMRAQPTINCTSKEKGVYMFFIILRRHCLSILQVLSIVLVLCCANAPGADGIPIAVSHPLIEELTTTVNCIAVLEGKRDPKCYATASRLENFITGTPLSHEAQNLKAALQKDLVNGIWKLADESARASDTSALSAADLGPVMANIARYGLLNSGDWIFETANGKTLTIPGQDKRQYANIAYGLRAILALQQERLLGNGDARLPLDASATEELKQILDIYSLAALQMANEEARLSDQRKISAEVLRRAWNSAGKLPAIDMKSSEVRPASNAFPAPPPFEMTRRVIAQKIASYEAYNQISMPVFLRNIQVYFARHLWPTDSEQSDRIKAVFTEAMISYADEFVLGAERISRQRGAIVVQAEDVVRFADTFIPHEIDQFEDATFFPKFPRSERIMIEAYDMDAFRDSGLHWQYLRAAISEPDFKGTLEPDPFALELLVENIAQFGVLVLRVAGQAAAGENMERLAPQHIEIAMGQIIGMVQRHSQLPEKANEPAKLASASRKQAEQRSEPLFSDATAAFGLHFVHRSSDWMNRLIRAYSVRDGSVAVLAVPPAFGGSGAAAEDINGDGLPDLLLLGGGGTQLLLNDGKGGLSDIAQRAGIAWRGEDGLPGETRQPIIADFDNDGLQDIFITYVNAKHRLYRNKGNLLFEDVTDKAKLGGEGLVGGPAVAMDFDQDGLLDLYITYFGLYTEGVLPTLARRNVNGLPNRLFRNMGDMGFKDVTEGSGVAGTGWTQAAAHTDFNLDGLQDLIEGNDFGVSAYDLNQGDGTFKNVAEEIATAKPSYTMGIGIADLNNDLIPDFYISNIVAMDKDQKYVNPSVDTPMKFDPKTMAYLQVIEANDLFISQPMAGKLNYEQSEAIARGWSSTGWAWGADFFDCDNDGDEDLYVANGMNDFSVYSTDNPYYQDPEGTARNVQLAKSSSETNVFFLNEGGKLLNASAESGADLLGNSRAVAYADLDQDGDLDMILNNYHEPATIFRNNAEQFGNRWLKIKLEGDPGKNSTRDAIGATLIVKTEDGNQIWREVHGGGAYLTLHPKEQHFGLGAFTKADLSVKWPNGETESFPGLESNRRYSITQTKGIQ
jgi:hypothetical protein